MRQSVSEKRLVVLGATGGTGRQLVAAALERGHRVTALVRRAGSFDAATGLVEYVWSDLGDGGSLARALSGADAVISTLGGAAKGPTTVCTDAIRTTVPAMTLARVSRLVVLSAHGVLETHDRSLFSLAVWAGVGDKMKDKESMEPLITGSMLDWTIVRPPMLKNAPATDRYQVGENLPIRLWDSIGRADLAGFLLREVEDPRFVRKYPRIHR
ncbi:NAD(P)-dependent oxidoreductase [Kribbella ginsengisoli]|uniref:SDR family oxidoreductase n=1 Tax=Kribbella ginsengisoli TaxID=363865 RepID=A0ABP6W3Y4_9ACTN